MRKVASAAVPQNGPTATGWLLSCLVHGGLIVAALLFVQRLQLLPETESFQWNVAMVGASSSSIVPPPSTTSTAPPSTPNRSAPPTTKPVRPRSETQALAPQSTLSHQSIDHASTQPHTPMLSTIEVPPSSRGVTPTLAEPSTHFKLTSESLPPMPDESHTQQTDSENSLSSPIASVPTTSVSPETALSKPAREDYGWLAELMAEWIEDLDKRYPAMLRAEGVQGKVTLTAMLHEDGLLSDVRIVKSSGNTTLDNVALEDVRNGPPIKLSRPLERSRMPVKFSISYDLRTAR